MKDHSLMASLVVLSYTSLCAYLLLMLLAEGSLPFFAMTWHAM
ncbi:hypothetical protein SAMN06265795_104227 [Noviherbaspirillum humi]|uniref:Uncharacterized protein n=1 Tax=Noviherbaspirillum humi TaxID=1688639 RepID=A0A239G4D3_9BURK|nr:hypothetical protein [Noviherbaspirillum humi]SNS63492.1 hypothetical protein SAMN06265795_104227 [Noviherbaspirillum humi]